MIIRVAARRERTAPNAAPERRPVAPPLIHVSGPRLRVSLGDTQQPFFIASIDKVFVATLIAQLFDASRLGPETPLGAVLPQADLATLPAFPGVVPAKDITVEHLLSHTSGLPDVMAPPRGHSTGCSIASLRNKASRHWTTRQMLAEAAGLPALAPPGHRFHYADTGYLLLMRIVEEAAADSYGSQLRRLVFEPCEMQDTSRWTHPSARELAVLRSRVAPFAFGRSRHNLAPTLAPQLGWTGGLGGVSTAQDLVRFQQRLHHGELFDARWLGFLAPPRHRLRPGIAYGAGMASLRFGGFSPLLRGLPEPVGGLGYTATHLFYYPEQRTHVVLNFHAHARMAASVRAHIRLARLIKARG